MAILLHGQNRQPPKPWWRTVVIEAISFALAFAAGAFVMHLLDRYSGR